MISLGIKISWLEYLSLFVKIIVINAVTPFASGSEPYTIYWLRTRGMKLSDANVISIINGLLSGITEILITLPSFIFITLKYNKLSQQEGGILVYWFIVGGILVNFLVLASFIVIGFTKKIHYYISLLFNFVLKKLNRNYLSKDQIFNKYVTNSLIKQEIKLLIKQFRYVLGILLACFFTTLYSYNTLYLSFLCLSNDAYFYNFNHYLIILNIINVSITANNFIPIPGGEGTLQASIIILVNILSNNMKQFETTFINNVVGYWRCINNYLLIIVSIILSGSYYLLKIHLMRYNKNKNNLFKI